MKIAQSLLGPSVALLVVSRGLSGYRHCKHLSQNTEHADCWYSNRTLLEISEGYIRPDIVNAASYEK